MQQKVKTPDTQYRNLLKLILEKGIRSHAQQGTDTISLIGAPPMRFRFDDHFHRSGSRTFRLINTALPLSKKFDNQTPTD
jgi:thymidylate synthase